MGENTEVEHNASGIMGEDTEVEHNASGIVGEDTEVVKKITIFPPFLPLL